MQFDFSLEEFQVRKGKEFSLFSSSPRSYSSEKHLRLSVKKFTLGIGKQCENIVDAKEIKIAQMKWRKEESEN